MRRLIHMFILLAAGCQPCFAQSGVYSFEQTCRTGNCPLTSGPATCVAIGRASAGDVVLTAAHCVENRTNVFYVVGKTGVRDRAELLFVDQQADVALLLVKDRSLYSTSVASSAPRPGDPVTMVGVLSRRRVDSKGPVVDPDQQGRMYTKTWSHSGCSGGGLFNSQDQLVGIQSGKVLSGYGAGQSISASHSSIRRIVSRFEQRYGKVQAIERHQARYNCPPCNCQQQPQMMHVPVPLQPGPPGERGERGLTGNTGAIGPRGPKGDSPNPQAVADALFATYGDRLRGPAGNAGASVDEDRVIRAVLAQIRQPEDGVRGNDGRAGESAYQIAIRNGFSGTEQQWLASLRGDRGSDGANGLVGVPDEADIQTWLVGAMSRPETRQALSTMLSDLIAEDPRVQELLDRVQSGSGSAFDEAQIAVLRNSIIDEIRDIPAPLTVRNADGSLYGEAPDRRALDPITINLASPQK